MHIADPTSFIPLGSDLDFNASLRLLPSSALIPRSVTYYYPDRVYPLYPWEVATACSLSTTQFTDTNPGRCSSLASSSDNRYHPAGLSPSGQQEGQASRQLQEGKTAPRPRALTIVMEFGADGSILDCSVRPTVLQNPIRLTYEEVEAILNEALPPARRRKPFESSVVSNRPCGATSITTRVTSDITSDGVTNNTSGNNTSDNTSDSITDNNTIDNNTGDNNTDNNTSDNITDNITDNATPQSAFCSLQPLKDPRANARRFSARRATGSNADRLGFGPSASSSLPTITSPIFQRVASEAVSPQSIQHTLTSLYRLACRRRQYRERRGCIDFSFAEARFHVAGGVAEGAIGERDAAEKAEQLVMEMMVAAGEVVGAIGKENVGDGGKSE